jgi:hypothetical protein
VSATTQSETTAVPRQPDYRDGGTLTATVGGHERESGQLLARSPTLARGELLSIGAFGVLLAVITSWPLALHLGSRIAPDLGDPVRTAWQVAWVGHALLHQPLHLWSSNAFWPAQHSLAFSDSLLGYAPSALIGHGPTAALVRYNLLFLFAYALAFVGPYLLAREIGLGRAGAAVAGAAFAYAPYRAAEAGHLHVISSGGIALTLFLLLRGYRRGSVAIVAAGWITAAWQLSLGFTLGLQLSYLLSALALVAAFSWLRAGRRPLPRRLVTTSIAGVALFGLVAAFQGHPYLQVSNDYPSARRTVAEVQRYSAPVKALLAAPVENRVWGAATAPVRNSLSSKNESELFPGALIALLALIGVAAPVLVRRLRLLLLGGAALTALLALGLSITSGGYPYRLLYDYLPGWDAIRTPGRLTTMTSLALALLAGAGAHWLLRRRALATRTAAPVALAGLLVAAVVFEGAGRMADPVVPVAPAGQLHLRGPVLELPTDPANDRLYQLWSTADWQRIANGNSTFDIPAQDDLRGGMQNFPDAAGVAKLQRIGIRTVVLHLVQATLPPLHYAIPEPPDANLAATKSIVGLPLTRRRVGSVVIFEIAPAARGVARVEAARRPLG